MGEQQFIPILLGSDRNVYGMAVAFHEEYAIKSISLGKFDSTETQYSKIIEFYKDENIEEPDIFIKRLKEIHEKYIDKKLLLVACSDVYMKLVIRNKKELEKYFLIPYIDEKLMDKLILKEEFYKICEEYKLDYPKTKICEYKDYKNFKIDFNYPIIIKPSNSVSYWQASFEEKSKVFIAQNEDEFKEILDRVYHSTYKDNLIIQEYIPGDDTHLRVLNAYVNKNHKVTFMALGQILLEEKMPKCIGDYGAIISSYDMALFDKIRNFLEKIKYVGYANFDLKYNEKTKKLVFFEINIRQGRSSSFTTVSGKNITKYLVNDYVYNKNDEIEYLNNEYLWTIVPKYVILKFVNNNDLTNKAKRLYKEKKVRNILLYKNDFSIKRYIKIKLKTLNYLRKYNRYYK